FRPDQQCEILIVIIFGGPRDFEDSPRVCEQRVHATHLSAGIPDFLEFLRTPKIREPNMRANRLMVMTDSGIEVASTQSEILRNAYRATFQEYSRSLDALQRLMDSGTSDSGR